ncbi:MAG: hypothetical protein K2K53_03640 [Oscillospiraceae bacterium]|nr:hypothetical protein [Oscillospiraceae bacterium]
MTILYSLIQQTPASDSSRRLQSKKEINCVNRCDATVTGLHLFVNTEQDGLPTAGTGHSPARQMTVPLFSHLFETRKSIFATLSQKSTGFDKKPVDLILDWKGHFEQCFWAVQSALPLCIL